jgi:predicted phage tail protein
VKDDENYAFNGAANTVRQGVPVPICYGQLMVGGAVISSGITNENYSP